MEKLSIVVPLGFYSSSGLCYLLSPLVVKFVFGLLLEIILRQNHPQGTIVVGKFSLSLESNTSYIFLASLGVFPCSEKLEYDGACWQNIDEL